jgi:hypothetical protein
LGEHVHVFCLGLYFTILASSPKTSVSLMGGPKGNPSDFLSPCD